MLSSINIRKSKYIIIYEMYLRPCKLCVATYSLI